MSFRTDHSGGPEIIGQPLDSTRIGAVGQSYGGKWAVFATAHGKASPASPSAIPESSLTNRAPVINTGNLGTWATDKH